MTYRRTEAIERRIDLGFHTWIYGLQDYTWKGRKLEAIILFEAYEMTRTQVEAKCLDYLEAALLSYNTAENWSA
jgi:hypothetical protein